MEDEVAALVCFLLFHNPLVPNNNISIRLSITALACARLVVRPILHELLFSNSPISLTVAGNIPPYVARPMSMLITIQVMMPLAQFSRMFAAIVTFTLSLFIWITSSIVGRPRHQGVMVGMGQKDSYVG